MNYLRRCWCEIQLSHLEYNINLIKGTAQKCVMAIVKANAYGHGDSIIASRLQQLGIGWFGVSNINEALTLRKAGVVSPILILGYTPPQYVKALTRHNLSQTIVDLDHAKALSQATNTPLQVHFKIDTGMSRIGFGTDEVATAQLLEAVSLPHLQVEGVFSHFSCSDSFDAEDEAFTERQSMLFSKTVQTLADHGIQPTYRHLANSAGIFNYPNAETNLVRAGIVLYGLCPSEEVDESAKALLPLLTWKTAVEQVKVVNDVDVSYGRSRHIDTPRKIATLTVGYADGYPRLLSNHGAVLVQGKRCPIVGRICMDQMMIDVTGLDVAVDDEVILIGRDGNEEITADEVAKWAYTIPYEIVCGISRRVPRLYFDGERLLEIIDESA